MNRVDGTDDPQNHPPFAAQDTVLLSPWLRSLPVANSPLENIISFSKNIDVNDRDSIQNLAFQDSLYDTLGDDILRLCGRFANLNKLILVYESEAEGLVRGQRPCSLTWWSS